MRHIIVLAVFAAIATSAFTTVLVNGLIFAADPVRSANEDTPTEGVHPPTEADDLIQGDVDCDGDVDAVDGLKDLQHVAAIGFTQAEPCPDVGTVIPAGEGVPGPPGPAGPQGEQGPQGEPGISDYEIVSKTYTLSSDTAAGIWVTSNAYCPEGLKALGGGGHLTYNGGFNPAAYPGGYIISSFPAEQAGSGSWSVTWKHDDNGGFSGGTEFNAYAICANVAE